MAARGRPTRRGSPYLVARLVKKPWLSARILAVLERFLHKEYLRRSLKRVIQRNGPAVREVLDVWGTTQDRRELDNLLLARSLARGPAPDEPLCSIVIPIFNNAALTYSCLRSILLARVSAPFEVIAVDDGSTDAVPEVLEHFRARITVIANEDNRGFVAACNRGAAAARAPFLVFLNNDTLVPDGWLDRLLETARAFDDAGAVGAKLVFPDGSIQEAGGIVWNDGSAVNYGRWDDPDAPQYNFVREVDYCSAACLLVRRDLFERLGGFDIRYAPAFYEDTDLCFGLRDMGYAVYYQPRCEIVHCEGATAGSDPDLGFKRYQRINRTKFAEKWHAPLSRQKPPGPRRVREASDRRTGPRVLVFDAEPPTFDRDAGSLRMFSILETLTRMGYQVAFLLRRKARLDRYGRALGGIGVRLVPENEVFAELAAGRHDLVVVSRLAIAKQFLKRIKKAAPRVPVLFDTVDVHFVREMRRAELETGSRGRKQALRIKKEELGIARACDLTIAITAADKEHLLAEDPSLRVEIVPSVHEPVDVEPSPAGRRGLMFIGGFQHPPNTDAMLYFAAEIFPALVAELEDVELLIVGSHPSAEVEALASERITVTGFVADTAPYFGRSRVFVCPLRYGSGMKGKIGEALAHGIPVVTTSIGAEGMGLVHGETAMIQDSPVDFRSDVVRVYRDDALWTKLARNGQRHIAQRFGPAALRERLEKTLSGLPSQPRS
jgi:GT2 family glycosyltransferase/glycosyltransferase involved in cell wall biosynthesis